VNRVVLTCISVLVGFVCKTCQVACYIFLQCVLIYLSRDKRDVSLLEA
jgi:hypothetical protein